MENELIPNATKPKKARAPKVVPEKKKRVVTGPPNTLNARVRALGPHHEDALKTIATRDPKFKNALRAEMNGGAETKATIQPRIDALKAELAAAEKALAAAPEKAATPCLDKLAFWAKGIEELGSGKKGE